jgi:hypothetical protein
MRCRSLLVCFGSRSPPDYGAGLLVQIMRVAGLAPVLESLEVIWPKIRAQTLVAKDLDPPLNQIFIRSVST